MARKTVCHKCFFDACKLELEFLSPTGIIAATGAATRSRTTARSRAATGTRTATRTVARAVSVAIGRIVSIGRIGISIRRITLFVIGTRSQRNDQRKYQKDCQKQSKIFFHNSLFLFFIFPIFRFAKNGESYLRFYCIISYEKCQQISQKNICPFFGNERHTVLQAILPENFYFFFHTFLHQVRFWQFGHFRYRVVPMCIAFNACA